MFGDELKAIKSLKMITDRVYTFEYRGDYGFKSFLEQGRAKTDAQMAEYIAGFLSKGYIDRRADTGRRMQHSCGRILSSKITLHLWKFLLEHITI